MLPTPERPAPSQDEEMTLEERVAKIEERLSRQGKAAVLHNKALDRHNAALNAFADWATGMQGWVEQYQESNHFNDTEGKGDQ